ncbi:MAG: UDP-N-acetylmuramoyl-L-alanine--D-glutamate ligase [Rickettsiales bacterium]|jgi:UDP-N-acetylmuramoylalanine--D-glutamate ligase|nr:UDP-N-acetylmuramoyl-L-alanine--D-glutamate ligase [Rickettsiales bacterium]
MFALKKLKNLSIGIWGMGVEGKAVYDKLSAMYPNKNIVVIDDTNATEYVDKLDLIVRSPGVSIYKNEIKNAKKTIFITEKSIFYSELAECDVVTIGITGSKGKTTTSTFCNYILEKTGYKTMLTGNMGVPTINLVDKAKKCDFVVTELSSYQTSDLQAYPKAGILLNLYPEHIDWHRTHENYFRDKKNLLNGVKIGISEYWGEKEKPVDLTNEFVFLKYKIEERKTKILDEKTIKGGLINQIVEQKVCDVDIFENIIKQKKYDVNNFPVIYKDNAWWQGDKKLWSTANMKLLGEHNYKNLSFVFSLLYELKIDLSKIKQEYIDDFAPIEHRLEIIKHDDIIFVNDSISTIPEAALACYKTFRNKNIYGILGGFDRKQDYSIIVNEIKNNDNIKFIALLGQTKDRIAKNFDDVKFKNYKICENLKECMKILREKAKNDNNIAIILSPAAPSYDMYKSFEYRGREFKGLI